MEGDQPPPEALEAPWPGPGAAASPPEGASPRRATFAADAELAAVRVVETSARGPAAAAARARAHGPGLPSPTLSALSQKSFASKSLGQAARTGAQVTLHRLCYRVPGPLDPRRPWAPRAPVYLLGAVGEAAPGVTGTLDPGTMVALMGSSGAGKSTLMDVISGRKTQGAVEGLVLFDGHVPSPAERSRDTGYVEQFDTLWGTFSIFEMLMYTARLKMGPEFSLAQKAARVHEVIDQLGLAKAQDTKIGGFFVRGISGGEKKRVSIGIGLLNNPRIMFFDEPTSGLDSAISTDVMQRIRDLADEGRSVMVTIHQPSGKIFNLFDQIVLLARDPATRSGNLVYWGPAGTAVREYFERQGFAYDAGEVDNIPEYLLSIVSGGVSGPKAGGKLIHAYRGSDLHEDHEYVAGGIVGLLEGEAKLDSAAVYANGMLSEIWTLFLYKGRACWRDPLFLIERIGLYVALSLILVSLFAPGEKTPMNLIIIVALLFITILMTSFITLLYVPQVINDKPVFIRESHDAAYRAGSYATSTFLIETSAIAVASVLYTSCLYYSIGGNMNTEVGSFFFFMVRRGPGRGSLAGRRAPGRRGGLTARSS